MKIVVIIFGNSINDGCSDNHDTDIRRYPDHRTGSAFFAFRIIHTQHAIVIDEGFLSDKGQVPEAALGEIKRHKVGIYHMAVGQGIIIIPL